MWSHSLPIPGVLYTADLVLLIQKHSLHCHLYADDTQVYGWCQPRDAVSLQDSMSHCIDDVSQWTTSNRLQLNALKTEYVWCTLAHRRHHIPSSDVKVSPDSVCPVQTARVLGVYIDGDDSYQPTMSGRCVSVHCDRYDPSSGLCRRMHWTHSHQSRAQPAGLL